MNVKEKLLKNNFIQDSPRFWIYNPYLDTIFDSVIDYGYVDKVVSSQKDNPNILHKDTEEFCVFRVKDDKKTDIEKIMQNLNIFLSKESLKKDGSAYEWFVFKSENLPELKAVIRGCVKTKKQEEEFVMTNMAKTRSDR